MKIDIITIFPDIYTGFLEQSMINKAQENGICSIKVHDLRTWTTDKHNTVDDEPYGGGPGMLFKAEPLHKAISELKKTNSTVIFTCPKGKKLTQNTASNISKIEHLIIIAGHYEGIDQRIIESLVDDSVSIGDFVLFGGELPSMVIIEAAVRLLPGAVGNKDSITEDSFQRNLLDHPQYTRPSTFLGQKVPDVLLSGHHKKIGSWRSRQSIISTFNERPDLMAYSCLLESEKITLTKYLQEE